MSFIDPQTGLTNRDTIDVYDMSRFPRRDASSVTVELAPGTEREARLAGDVVTFEWDLSWLGLLVPAAVWWILRVWHLAAVGRTIRRDEYSYQMRGEVHRVGRIRGSPQLQLFALDAMAGAAPICSVRLIGRTDLPVDPFVCEVKGTPRPFGTVVARAGTGVLWPAGRALGWNARSRPHLNSNKRFGRMALRATDEDEPSSTLRSMNCELPGPSHAAIPGAIAALAVAAFVMIAVSIPPTPEWLSVIPFVLAGGALWLASEARRTRALRLLSQGFTPRDGTASFGAFSLGNGRLWFGARRAALRRQRVRFDPAGVVIVHGDREHCCAWRDFDERASGFNRWTASTASPWWAVLGKGRPPKTLAIRLSEPIRLGLWRRRTVLMPIRWFGATREDAAIRLIDTLHQHERLRDHLADPQSLALLMCSWAAGDRLQLADRSVDNPWPVGLCKSTRSTVVVPRPWRINHR